MLPCFIYLCLLTGGCLISTCNIVIQFYLNPSNSQWCHTSGRGKRPSAFRSFTVELVECVRVRSGEDFWLILVCVAGMYFDRYWLRFNFRFCLQSDISMNILTVSWSPVYFHFYTVKAATVYSIFLAHCHLVDVLKCYKNVFPWNLSGSVSFIYDLSSFFLLLWAVCPEGYDAKASPETQHRWKFMQTRCIWGENLGHEWHRAEVEVCAARVHRGVLFM